jgi:hypothetical protein
MKSGTKSSLVNLRPSVLVVALSKESTMATELLELQLEELSLVDRPANAEAMVTLFKRDVQEEVTTKMDAEMEDKVKAYMEEKGCGREEAMKALGYEMDKAEEPAEESVEDEAMKSLQAEVETLKAENERLRKGLIENGFVIKAEAIEKKAPAEFIEVEGEKINKADIPAPILKKLEEAEAAQEAAAIAKKAEETLPNFKPEVAQALMKFDLEAQILEALMAADKLFEAQMEEVGKADVDGDMDDPQAKLDKMVDAYAMEHELTKAQAYAKVAKTAEGKALINKTYKKD